MPRAAVRSRALGQLALQDGEHPEERPWSCSPLPCPGTQLAATPRSRGRCAAGGTSGWWRRTGRGAPSWARSAAMERARPAKLGDGGRVSRGGRQQMRDWRGGRRRSGASLFMAGFLGGGRGEVAASGWRGRVRAVRAANAGVAGGDASRTMRGSAEKLELSGLNSWNSNSEPAAAQRDPRTRVAGALGRWHETRRAVRAVRCQLDVRIWRQCFTSSGHSVRRKVCAAR